MKNTLFALLLGSAIFAGCEKNTFNATERAGIEGKSLVKIGMFSMTGIAVNQLLYDNGERISGAFASPYPYPGGGYNTSGGSGGDYFALAPGAHTFQFWSTNPGTANIITKLFETTQTFDAEKRYTVFIADTAANEVAIKVEDDGKAYEDSGYVTMRLINLIPNSGALDFYQNSTLIKSNLAYKDYTEFLTLQSGTADTFSVRPAGSAPGYANTALSWYRLALNTNKRVLTMVSRGYIGFPFTGTDVRRPLVSIVVNQ